LALKFLKGLDVRGIDGVINYGIPAKVPTKTQRDGRAERSTDDEAFCINMVEPWFVDMGASPIPSFQEDPNRPLLDAGLTKKVPNKQERTGAASIRLATSPDCQRVLGAEYYDDNSPEGPCFAIILT
jgi:ATP-dependent helicase YprA (DUF1998 family)